MEINGRKYSIEELKKGSNHIARTPFEKTTLQFCRAWLSGQQHFIIHTSGSTGAPKEIQLEREAMKASAQMTIRALQLKPSETSLVCLDTQYIAGQMMLVRSLQNKMSMVAIEPTANPFKDINQPVDFVALVPYQLETILDQSPEKLSQVRCALVGGAGVSQFLQKKISRSKCAVYATYGMTETISHIALQRLNGDHPQDYFEALDQVRLRLDERGCLSIRTPYLSSEIITNDLVELIDEKKFRWLGRIDHVINSGGVKIIPEKVEMVFEKILQSLLISNRFFIAGLPDKKWGQRVVVFMEGSSISDEDQHKMIEIASQKLGKYEVPQEFIFIHKFTEAANGKINRREVVSVYKQ